MTRTKLLLFAAVAALSVVNATPAIATPDWWAPGEKPLYQFPVIPAPTVPPKGDRAWTLNCGSPDVLAAVSEDLEPTWGTALSMLGAKANGNECVAHIRGEYSSIEFYYAYHWTVTSNGAVAIVGGHGVNPSDDHPYAWSRYANCLWVETRTQGTKYLPGDVIASGTAWRISGCERPPPDLGRLADGARIGDQL
jgi:hypothetical protein